MRSFATIENLQCVMLHNGSGAMDQLGELKRGAEIVVGTPARIVDLLVHSRGRIPSLRRQGPLSTPRRPPLTPL